MTSLATAPATRRRVALLAARTGAELGDLLSGDALPSGYRGPGPRVAVVDPTPERLELAAKVVAKARPWRGRRDIWFSPEPLLAGGGKLAFVFAGLEADVVPRVDDVAALLDVDVPEFSTKTIGRHAASVFVVDSLLDVALRRIGVQPDMIAGHSSGEWQAMVAGGIVARADFDDMMDRADLDALRVPGVEFGVLGCPADRLPDHLGDLVISHLNSANQTVVCGPAEQVDGLIGRLRSAGVICQRLPFRSGFHTPMLEPYLEPYRVSGLPSLPMRAASTPVWSANTASPFPDDPEQIRRLCVRHLLEPVRFLDVVRGMYQAGARVFVQVGIGQLGSLIDDTLRDSDHLTIAANAPHRSGVEQLRRVAAAIWVEGGAVNGGLQDLETRCGGLEDTRPLVREPVLARLAEMGEWSPAVADFGALMSDAAAAVSEIVAAARQPERAPLAPVRRTMEVSTAAMPYLLDHCMAHQPEGWPDERDRRPVMPATTMVAHLVQTAAEAAPGRVIAAVERVRFRRWLVASPPERVEVSCEPIDQHRMSVRLGDHCDAVIVLADNHAAGPSMWPVPRDERTPSLTAERLYSERWMFHGPLYQGVTKAVGISPETIRGEITVLPPPGALLDNFGQMIGQWLVEQHPQRSVAFPAGIDRIEFYAPEPPATATVDAHVRITERADDALAVDGQISSGGQVLISVAGWRDYRVEGDQWVSDVHRMPERRTLARRQPGGWWLLVDPWTSVASREFYLRKYLSTEERDAYQRCAPTDRRGWLLRRIAAKDAVRGWLWADVAGPLYPVQIALEELDTGQFTARGRHFAGDMPALSVATAQSSGLCAAVVEGPPGSSRRGVEVAEVIEASLAVHKDIKPAGELLLDRLRQATGDALPTALARFAAAKAAAKHAGHPGEITGVDGPILTVTRTAAADRAVRVNTAVVRGPGGPPYRSYVVASTE